MLDQVSFWLDLRRVRIKGCIRRLPYLARNLIRAIRGNWLFDARYMSRRTMKHFKLFLDGEDVTDRTTRAMCSIHPGVKLVGWIACLRLDEHDRIMTDQEGEIAFVTKTGVTQWMLK